jgi:hypothetical protein
MLTDGVNNDASNLHVLPVTEKGRAVRDRVATGNARLHFVFLASYFSSFMEGTRFEANVACGIVLNGRVVETRQKSSHDIPGVFRQVHHLRWWISTLSRTGAVLKQIQERHAEMMKRPEGDPGEFAICANAAGTTRFVVPRLPSMVFNAAL